MFVYRAISQYEPTQKDQTIHQFLVSRWKHAQDDQALTWFQLKCIRPVHSLQMTLVEVHKRTRTQWSKQGTNAIDFFFFWKEYKYYWSQYWYTFGAWLKDYTTFHSASKPKRCGLVNTDFRILICLIYQQCCFSITLFQLCHPPICPLSATLGRPTKARWQYQYTMYIQQNSCWNWDGHGSEIYWQPPGTGLQAWSHLQILPDVLTHSSFCLNGCSDPYGVFVLVLQSPAAWSFLQKQWFL